MFFAQGIGDNGTNQSRVLRRCLLALEAGLDEMAEQGVRPHGPALELGVKLAPDVKWMVRKLHHLHQPTVGREPHEPHPSALELLPVIVVELIAVAVPLRDLLGSVDLF